MNLRHAHMPQKYDLDPQFPLTRYYNGLSSPTVPNRFGEYPTPTSNYKGTNNCTNPLFAASLPSAADVPDATSVNPSEISTTLCDLPAGTTRNAGDVFYAHIGGVPHQLLQSTPGDGTCPAGSAAADCPQKAALASADWVKILGASAAAYTPAADGTFPTVAYDYTGIDPHMIESMSPRNDLPAAQTPAANPATSTLSGPSFSGTAIAPDPINGREWTTTGLGAANAATFQYTHVLPVDLEYACIFQLPVKQQRDCATLNPSTIEGNSCDCAANWQSGSARAPNNPPDQVPPICGQTSSDGTTIVSAVSDYTVQVAAKAYPTIRELTLANMMGYQGVVSSLCPIHTEDNAAGNDPLYGYRPAMDALVNRLKVGLTTNL
jgi:hypothetical protein